MLTEVDKQVVRALADNDMKVTRTANALYFHYKTVKYHIEEIKKKTGLDPRRFWDLVKLLEGVRRDEN